MNNQIKFSSSRLSNVKPSASVAVSQLGRELKAQGKDIIDLGIGQPDFDTPAHIIEAAHQAALAGKTRYTPMRGTAELCEAIRNKLKRENHLDYAEDEVIVSNGAKQIIFSAMLATVETDDEVLICAPYFGCYRDIVLSVGGTPKTIECSPDDDFRLTPERLSQVITSKTRWLMLNLPNNPSGAVYDEAQLKAIGEVLEQHPQVILLSDEIYEHILFDGREFVSSAHALPHLKDRILTVNGVSKAYAMTGWRIGYGAGPKALIDVMAKVQSQVSSAPCSVAQAAAAQALNGPQDSVTQFNEAFERRRNLVVEAINKIPGLTLRAPGGAFYGYVGCEELIGTTTPKGDVIKSDTDLASYLIHEAGVASVPGSAYELSPYIRLSTANSDENLTEAMHRIGKAVAQLKTS